MSQADNKPPLSPPAPAGAPAAGEQRVLVLAPTRKDAQMCQAILASAGLAATVCAELIQIFGELQAGAAALLLTEEALAYGQLDELAAVLGRQPPWSELPVLLLIHGGVESPLAARVMEQIQNVMLLEQPVQRLTLISAVRAAVKSRQRQYQLREYLAEQQRQQEALRASEQDFRMVAEAVPQIVWATRPDGWNTYFNQQWVDYTGMTMEESRGHGWNIPFHPEDRQRAWEAWQRATKNNEPYSLECRLRRADGVYRWWLIRGAPMRDASGEIVKWFGTCTDIEDLKRAEEELRQSERFALGTIDALSAHVCVTDDQGVILAVNQAWRAFAYANGAIAGNVMVGANCLAVCDAATGADAADAATFAAGMRAVLRGERRAFSFEYPCHSPRERRWFTARVTRFPGNGPTRLVIAHEDITGRKQAEEALVAAKAAVEAASLAKDHFLAVLSHELRTPLTAVLPALQVLEELVPARTAEEKELLEMVRRNVEMESRLIDDLLDLTRISRGKIELDRRPVELGTILRHAAEVCQPDIEGRRLHFSLEIKDPRLIVDADAGRLQQVFWNLIKNAVKFTPHDGGVEVRAYRQDDTAVVEVRDSGVGIEPQVLGRIFNAFEQGDRSVTRQFGGLGLGLAITKALVDLHGGTVSAFSEGKGKGAKFVVKLPIVSVPAPAVTTGPPARPLAPPRPLRILLVEDHGDTAYILRRLLQKAGNQVEQAGDVATALQLAAEQPFDLLLSDLGLPDGSGVDLIRALRQRGDGIPGIALSGYGQEEDLRRSKEAGFALHLTKPISPQRLSEAIADLVGGGTSEG